MRNKKYVFFIVFLLSSHNVVSPSIIQDPSYYVSVQNIQYAIGVVIFVIISKKIISPIARYLLLKKIFFEQWNEDEYKYIIDFSAAQHVLEKYTFLIRLAVKFLVFLDYTATQYAYTSYIDNLLSDMSDIENTQPIILFLLKCGINPRYSMMYKQSILTTLCENKNTTKMIEYALKELKLDANDRDRKVEPPMEELITVELGSNIKDASDPLSVACYFDNLEAVRLLIQCNTHTHPFLDCDSMEVTPIERAIEKQNNEMFALLTTYTVLKQERHTIIRQLLLLEEINNEKIKNKEVTRKIVNDLINVTISPLYLSIDSCFKCDEKIWLPHNHSALYSGRMKIPSRMCYDEKKCCSNERIAYIKGNVKKFLKSCDQPSYWYTAPSHDRNPSLCS